MENKIQKENDRKKEYILKLKDLRRTSKKNKAILSFKYDSLNRIINFVHISVIVVSTIITFLETMKAQFDFESRAWEIIPIILASYIGLSMAILRFLKLEENKEEIAKCREDHVSIVNKFVKTIDRMETFNIEDSNLEQWNNLVENYESDVFDNYITIRSRFDYLMNYTDVIYYKKMYQNYYLKEKFVNENIELIRDFKNIPNKGYWTKGCCGTIEKIDSDKFFTDIEEGNLDEFRFNDKIKNIRNNRSIKKYNVRNFKQQFDTENDDIDENKNNENKDVNLTIADTVNKSNETTI